MAFLDPKEELLKIVLTDYGRKKLSMGGLDIKYYTFADDEVNYNNGDVETVIEVAEILSASLVNDSGEVLVNDSGDIIYVITS